MRRLTIVALAVSALGVFSAPAIGLTGPLPPGGTFTDDNRIAEEGYIEAIAAIGVTRGCNPPVNNKFCPNRGVTRAEMASFLVRALSLPPAASNPFTDTVSSVHVNTIASLAQAGITRGCNPPANDQFCPERVVTRGEMAAFLSRAYGLTGPVDESRFSDDNGSLFETDISRIAQAGFTSGCGTGLYCPKDPMLRRHMAVFIGRALGLTPVVVPAPPEILGSFTTYYEAGQPRVINIQSIADAVDGAVVQPGETFSVNDHVGKRTVEKGYVAAGAIIGGILYCCDHPANIGGGTSQFATTLYNAIFFSGVEDVYHRPHSIWFSRYPMGREATIGWTSPDVVFRNTTDNPITIDVSYTRTSITVSLIGVSDVADVRAIRTGSATTSGGGTVTIQRVITYRDGRTVVETRTHTYRGLPSDDDDDHVHDDQPPPDDGTGPQ